MSEKIIYLEKLPEPDEFWDLYLTTGWNAEYKLTKEEIYKAMCDCWYVISAYDGDKLVGFARIDSDGLLHAMIYELIVDPEYQGKGIGKNIMIMLLEKCRQHDIRDIQLFCAKGKRGFYEKLGFIARPDDGPGMQLAK